MTNYTLSTGKTVVVADIDFTVQEKANGYYAVIYKKTNTSGQKLFDKCDLDDCLFLSEMHDIRMESR